MATSHLSRTRTVCIFVCLVLASMPLFVGAAPNETTSQRLDLNDSSLEDHLNILFSDQLFTQIEPEVLKVKNISRVLLDCEPTWKDAEQVKWKYHGLQESLVNIAIAANFINLLEFSAGPPVARLECLAKIKNKTISNSTYIYRGENKSPYLHNNSKLVSIKIVNETTVNLPCILNYPLDEDRIQLLKDGAPVDKDCMHYQPEYGFFLNLTKLEKPVGNYTCKVTNSTDDDFLAMELTDGMEIKDDLIRAEVKIESLVSMGLEIYMNDTSPRNFHCKVPKDKFENKFEWYFRWRNGTYSQIPEHEPTPQSDDKHYVDSVKLIFPSVSINGVVCAVYLSTNGLKYNNTFEDVHVLKPDPVHIVNDRSQTKTEYYTGLNLTCLSKGHPYPVFEWFKDGKPVTNLNTNEVFNTEYSRSELILDPKLQDDENNYTCRVSNFLANDTHSWTVVLPEVQTPAGRIWALSIGVCVIIVAIAAIVFVVFFKITPRRFSEEKIRNFLNGIGMNTIPYNEFQDQQPYETVQYDKTKEIDVDSLKIVKKLKGGTFGKVEFGYFFTETSSLPVAIKSIKDDHLSCKEDLDIAFDNFLKEIKIMQVLGEHVNVVRYVGAVTSDLAKYSAYLVTEYCCEGDLATYIRSIHKNEGSFQDDVQGLQTNTSRNSGQNQIVLKTSHLMKWSQDIAAGMEYIASKNLVHRDLAARNVLLSYHGSNDCTCPHDPQMLTAKISDFGLSKNLQDLPKEYYTIIFGPEKARRKSLPLPLRWFSVEALESLKFTTQSDVWAFGVTLWELFSLGDFPYGKEIPNDATTRESLQNYLKSGNVLREPQLAPSKMWEVMLSCWSEDPKERPSFKELHQSLMGINENRVNINNQDDSQRQVQTPPMATDYTSVTYMDNPGFNSEDCYSDEDVEFPSVQNEGYVSYVGSL